MDNILKNIEEHLSFIKDIIIGVIIASLIILLCSIIKQIISPETLSLPDSGKRLELDNGYEIYTVINEPGFKLIYLTKDKNIKNSLVKINDQWLVLE